MNPEEPTTTTTLQKAPSKALNRFEVVVAHSGSDRMPTLHAKTCRGRDRCDCCPQPRSGHRSFTDGDYVYIVGGYTSRYKETTLTDVWRFNVVIEQWQSCTVHGTLPNTLASFSLVYDARLRCAYIFGGTGWPFGEAAVNTLHRLRIDGDNVHVEELTITGQLPPKMYGQAMTFKKRDPVTGPERIYIMGGTSGHHYNMDVWELRPTLEYGVPTWRSTQLSPAAGNPHEGRYRHEIVLHQDRLLSFGGGSVDFCASFDELLCFDMARKNFTKVPTKPDPVHGVPTGRKCHGLVEYDGKVYIFGGCRDYEDASTNQRHCVPMNDVWSLDLETMQWASAAPMPQSVFFHSVTVTPESCVYVFAGCVNHGHERCNSVQRVWLHPPTLKHIAMRTALDRLNPYFIVEGPRPGQPGDINGWHSADRRNFRLGDPNLLVREVLNSSTD